ncbi:probable RNA methyltransferase CG11342 [Epargyreus clarus]|uniref:probable RNA methyltransferase CG11342 n=1 Tax=Epargyreus clarus TaxID=520877 RepID=UPI003C2DE742
MPQVQGAEIDPGAVIHGNFINYYSFHPSHERTVNFHPSMLPTPLPNEDVVCLDVGCNTGELTKELYNYLLSIYPLSNIKILAVDIDPILIERAMEQNDNSNITYIALDIMSNEGQEKIKNFLKSHNKKKFDVIFCFSVTMWIHINKGDDGLEEFLKTITTLSRSIVVEPQPWKCYGKAQRRLKRAGSCFPLFDKLKIRNDVDTVIETILLQNNTVKVYESPYSAWNRKIQSFHVTF